MHHECIKTRSESLADTCLGPSPGEGAADLHHNVQQKQLYIVTIRCFPSESDGLLLAKPQHLKLFVKDFHKVETAESPIDREENVLFSFSITIRWKHLSVSFLRFSSLLPVYLMVQASIIGILSEAWLTNKTISWF